jgi:1-acyl-sn-glycerol-3-phosphate acyltransferase
MTGRCRALCDGLKLYGSLVLLGVICLSWSVPALPLYLLLPARPGAAFARRIMTRVFAGYGRFLVRIGFYRLDLCGIDAIGAAAPALIAPNHPTVIDAIFVIARHPKLICVMKSSLKNNLFLGAGSRFARYIGNEPPRRMIAEAISGLRGGASVLLFPEGTRSRKFPINEFHSSVGLVAKHAGVPVQTLLIETDSPYLSKGWPLLKIPALPITYRIRLGRRFDPPADVRAFTAELEHYFRAELGDSPQRRWLGVSNSPDPAAKMRT